MAEEQTGERTRRTIGVELDELKEETAALREEVVRLRTGITSAFAIVELVEVSLAEVKKRLAKHL